MKKLYLRVGTSYYKRSLYPSLSKESIEVLVQWSPELIRQDHGKNMLSEIEKDRTNLQRILQFITQSQPTNTI